MIDYLKSLGSAILIIGLFFFIFSNAIGSSNFKRRSIFYLMFGFALLVILGIGVLEELQTREITQLAFASWIMPAVVLVYTTSFVVFNLIMAKRYHHNFKSYRSAKEKEQMFLYVLYQFEDVYLLKEQDGLICGEVILFDKGLLFHDEMLERWVNKKQIHVRQANRIGTALVTAKRNKKYYCYLIEVNNLEGLEGLKQISKYDLAGADMEPFHKKLVLRIGLQENFDLKM